MLSYYLSSTDSYDGGNSNIYENGVISFRFMDGNANENRKR